METYGGFRKKDQQFFYAKMSALAYAYSKSPGAAEKKKRGYAEKDPSFGEFHFDTKLSNPDVSVLVNPTTKELVIAVTGSRFGDKKNRFRDMRSDIGIALGTASSGKRVHEVRMVVRRARKKYPTFEATLTGHSLGGFVASVIGNMDDIPAIVFNRGSSPLTELKKKIKSDAHHVIHYTTNKGTTVDPVSISAAISGVDTKTHQIDTTSDKTPHSLSHFGSGQRPVLTTHISEKMANQMYGRIFSHVKKMVGNDTTFGSTLKDAAESMLPGSFLGVFPSDQIPNLTARRKYAILNLDKSDEPGSHWVAIGRISNNHTIFYDSFGRNSSKIIPSLHKSGNGRIVNTDDDVEQRVSETNCGARSLAWLVLLDWFGPAVARLI